MAGRGRGRGERDAFDIANEPLLDFPLVFPSLPGGLEFEDRRTWHPEPDTRPALSFDGEHHQLEVARRVRPGGRPGGRLVAGFPSPIVAFKTPSRVLICVRRKSRREVLFAYRRTRRGAGGRRRRNSYSLVSCR